jgi:hypothetical protein
MTRSIRSRSGRRGICQQHIRFCIALDFARSGRSSRHRAEHRFEGIGFTTHQPLGLFRVFHQKPDDTRRLAESSEAEVTIEAA